MCRSLYFEAKERPTNIGPIETWEYILPKEVFEGAETNPDNLGFCPNGNCNPGGVLNLTTCYKEVYDTAVPYLMSKPHLLDADAEYHTVLEGLKPTDELHGTRLFVEPITGLLLGERILIQSETVSL